MAVWTIPESCNNAPKQQWMIEWLQAWVCGEPSEEPPIVTINGRSCGLSELDLSSLQKVVIHSVITHGREGSIRAQAMIDEASGSKRLELMLFVKFTLGRQTSMKELHVLYVVHA